MSNFVKKNAIPQIKLFCLMEFLLFIIIDRKKKKKLLLFN